MDFSRFKAYDYGVMGLFILTIIGVSLSWYSVAVEGFDDAGVLGGISGWDLSLGIMCFVFALLALVWVGLKGVIALHGPIPYWYIEGLVLMVLGALIAVFALIRIVDKPGGEELFGLQVGYGAGIFIALIAGLLIAGCGYLASVDKSMAPGQAARAPMAGPGIPGPTARGGRRCQNCGTPLDAGARFCRSCGAPQ
jgi:hypothetical protein